MGSFALKVTLLLLVLCVERCTSTNYTTDLLLTNNSEPKQRSATSVAEDSSVSRLSPTASLKAKDKNSTSHPVVDGDTSVFDLNRFSADAILNHGEGMGYCRKKAICQPLNYTTCMGMKLPYSYTSLDLVSDARTQEQAQEQLHMWQGLRHLPKCWAVIQPFLCALYMPKCENGLVDLPSQGREIGGALPEIGIRRRTSGKRDNVIFRGGLPPSAVGWCTECFSCLKKGANPPEILHCPSFQRCGAVFQFQEMCKMTLSPCRVMQLRGNWPSFLYKCDNTTRYPPMCKNDVRELKFNTTGQCLEPLVPTENTQAYYDGVEGCGVPCQDPLYTKDEQEQIHQLIAWSGTVCFLFNLFTVATFMIDWRSANKYPALIIFYINICILVSCVGWLAQFLPGTRQDIVCRKDGTLRVSEPSAIENLSCVVIFVLAYYFSMAAIVWFAILTYAWHLSFQALGKVQEKIDKKGAYFHLVAWSLPLIFTITTMAMGEIDANSVAGICFLGYVNHTVRASLLLAPMLATVIVGGYFISRGLVTLVKLKIGSQDIISESASSKIRETIVRMGLFFFLLLLFVIVTFSCHMYEFRNQAKWTSSFRKYINCRIVSFGGTDPEKCRLEYRPSVSMMQLHVLAFFATGIVMSSWVWTDSTLEAWKRRLRQLFTKYEEPVRVKKHKVIAQAFAKRKTLHNDGRVSLTFHYTHEDPVGLNLDVHSIASQDLSSTWAAALPKLMTRRGALIGEATTSLSSQRRNSVDSEISYSIRRVSVESRRNSLDSQVSVQIAELTATARTTRATPLPTGGTRPVRTKRRKKDFSRQCNTKVARKESSTSLESQQILNSFTIGSVNLQQKQFPNLMKRRNAGTNLDESKINISAGAPPMQYSSDDENKKCETVACGLGEPADRERLPLMGLEKGVISKTCIEETIRTCLNNISVPHGDSDDILSVTLGNLRVSDISDCSDASDDGDSYCPELMQLIGSTSDASVFTHHTLGGSRVRTVAAGPCSRKIREVGTQTNPPGTIELHRLQARYSAPCQNCHEVPCLLGQGLDRVLGPVSAGYSYNAQKFLQDMTEYRSIVPLQQGCHCQNEVCSQ